MEWVVIAIVVFLIAAAVVYWPVTLGLAVAGIVIHLVRKEMAADRDRKATEIARINAHNSQQRDYYTKLVDLSTSSFALFEAMPKHLMNAEELLDQAELDFDEGAFEPFWDSIEQCALRLGHLDDGVRTITSNSQLHTEVARHYEETVSPFPIVLESVKGMVAANVTADRMKGIVRKAQRNFQFTTIFQQRKTNQLLIAGFNNLAQALDGMGRRIESSINDLAAEISSMSSNLDGSLQNLNQTFSSLHESSLTDRAKQHSQTLEMLDNIQRRRKPIL